MYKLIPLQKVGQRSMTQNINLHVNSGKYGIYGASEWVVIDNYHIAGDFGGVFNLAV